MKWTLKRLITNSWKKYIVNNEILLRINLSAVIGYSQTMKIIILGTNYEGPNITS